MSFESDKVALITGGAGGIGLAVTRKLLENGVKGVGVVDISEDYSGALSSLQEQYAEKLIFIKADVTKDEELKNAFEKTIHKFQNLDIVINNAAIYDESKWERTVSVNLTAVMRGTFLAIQEYLPKYNSSGKGMVLNTASILGIETLSNTHAYGATKHGVVGLGKSLGKDESCLKNNIRVITLCPGIIHTQMIGDLNTIKKPSDISKEVAEMCKKVSSTDYVAKSVLEIMNKAEHGSVWVAEDEEPPYQLVFPSRKEMRKTS